MSNSIPSATVQTSGAEISCSIEETNRIRALLGMKPLQLSPQPSSPQENYRTKDKDSLSMALQNRIQESKTRRQLAESIIANKSIAASRIYGEGEAEEGEEEQEDEDEEDPVKWVQKLKQIQERKARLKDGKDEERKQEAQKNKMADYTEKDMKGMKLKHHLDDFQEGEQVILTLADKSILDERGNDLNKDEDELENVLMAQKAKAQKNQNVKKADFRKQYDPTDENKRQSILAQYDDDDEPVGYRIGSGTPNPDSAPDQGNKSRDVASKLKKSIQDLNFASEKQKLQSDYMTMEEYAAKFSSSKKKSSKKKKIRKKNTEADLIEELEKPINDADRDELFQKRNDPKNIAEISENVRNSFQVIRKREALKREQMYGDETEEDDAELRDALARARRARQMQQHEEQQNTGTTKVISLLSRLPKNRDGDEMDENQEKIVFDEISEFVKNIEASGLDKDEILNGSFEDAMSEENDEIKDEDRPDSHVGIKEEMTEEKIEKDGSSEDDGALEAGGLTAALEHYRMVGALKEKTEYAGRTKDPRPDPSNLSWSDGKKQIKLQYVDEFGRELTTKEAWRQLCYKFHGKGPSRNTREKRLKKYLNEIRLKSKGGDDTPLASVAALKEETKQSGSAYVVLSGPAALVNKPTDSMPVPKASTSGSSQNLKRNEEGFLKRDGEGKIEIKFSKPNKKSRLN